MEKIEQLVSKSEAKAKENASKLTKRIATIDEKITELQKEKKRLSIDQKDFNRIANLRTDANGWKNLRKCMKWKKDIILAVLLSSSSSSDDDDDDEEKDIPKSLKEQQWDVKVPGDIRDDRDLLIARLLRKDFYEAYSIYNPERKAYLRNFRLPFIYSGDKEIILLLMKVFPEILEQKDVISKQLLDDDDVFKAFLNADLFLKDNIGRCASLYYHRCRRARPLLGEFSERIRSDKKFMLDACEKGLWNVSKVITGDLLDDITFALDVLEHLKRCHIPNDSLQRFTQRVRSNRDVVTAYVKQNGLVLEHATPELRQEESILRLAIADNAKAFLFCPEGEMKQRFINDKSFAMELFSDNNWTTDEPELYNILSPMLKADVDIIAAAADRDCFNAKHVPLMIHKDRAFWMKAVKETSTIWQFLPEKYKSDIAFARAIKSFNRHDHVDEIFKKFPELCNDPQIWISIFDSFEDDGLEENAEDWFGHYATQSILNNKEVMLRACGYDSVVLQYISTDLETDHDIIEAAVDADLWALTNIPHTSQVMFPDLLIRAIKNYADMMEDVNESVESLCPEAFMNLEVAEAWFEAGGCYDSSIFSRRLHNNPDFCLLLAKYRSIDAFLHGINRNLFFDKQFMTKAVKLNGHIFRFARGNVRQDEEIALIAFGGEKGEELYSIYKKKASTFDTPTLHKVLTSSKDKLASHKAFTKGLLFGFVDPDCKLSLLDQGKETSLSTKKLIAEYIGIPANEEFPLLRRAIAILSDLPDSSSINNEDEDNDSANNNEDNDEDDDDDDEATGPTAWGLSFRVPADGPVDFQHLLMEAMYETFQELRGRED